MKGGGGKGGYGFQERRDYGHGYGEGGGDYHCGGSEGYTGSAAGPGPGGGLSPGGWAGGGPSRDPGGGGCGARDGGGAGPSHQQSPAARDGSRLGASPRASAEAPVGWDPGACGGSPAAAGEPAPTACGADRACSACGTTARELGHKLKKCPCGQARYCHQACARAHWAEHKLVCQSRAQGPSESRAPLRETPRVPQAEAVRREQPRVPRHETPRAPAVAGPGGEQLSGWGPPQHAATASAGWGPPQPGSASDGRGPEQPRAAADGQGSGHHGVPVEETPRATAAAAHSEEGSCGRRMCRVLMCTSTELCSRGLCKQHCSRTGPCGHAPQCTSCKVDLEDPSPDCTRCRKCCAGLGAQHACKVHPRMCGHCGKNAVTCRTDEGSWCADCCIGCAVHTAPKCWGADCEQHLTEDPTRVKECRYCALCCPGCSGGHAKKSDLLQFTRVVAECLANPSLRRVGMMVRDSWMPRGVALKMIFGVRPPETDADWQSVYDILLKKVSQSDPAEQAQCPEYLRGLGLAELSDLAGRLGTAVGTQGLAELTRLILNAGRAEAMRRTCRKCRARHTKEAFDDYDWLWDKIQCRTCRIEADRERARAKKEQESARARQEEQEQEKKERYRYEHRQEHAGHDGEEYWDDFAGGMPGGEWGRRSRAGSGGGGGRGHRRGKGSGRDRDQDRSHPDVHTTQACLYVTLGVTRDSTAAEIKKAYHEGAKRWHPDRHAGGSDAQRAEAEARMKKITEAYRTLGDPRKRRLYDEFASGR